MNQNKIIKPKKEKELKQKSQLYQIDVNLDSILWNSKLKKFFLQYSTDENPLRVLDPETLQITSPLKFEYYIRVMRISKKEDKIVFLDEDYFFSVIEFNNYKIENQFESKIKNIISFMFENENCESVYAFSDFGLFKINLVSGKSQKLGFEGLKNIKKNSFKISSDCKILYGPKYSAFECFPGSYNAARGFKYRVYSPKFHEFGNTSNTLSKKDTLLVSGDKKGKLVLTDLRSYKGVNARQLKNKIFFQCIESTERLIFAGTYYGELLIMKTSYPFNVIYYQKINKYLYSIGLNQKYLLLGGRDMGNFKLSIFEMPESTQNSRNFKNIKKKKK